jgi:glycosyltransferase EpsJ
MNYAISAIVPIFNAEKWLRPCLKSILNQPFQNIELLLVNDGSTDLSGTICEEFAIADDRIKVIHKPNGGTSSAKNAGLRAARGKYIAFLDADDEIDPLFFVKLYATAEEQACEVLIGGYAIIPTNQNVSPCFRLHTVMNGKDLILSAASVHSNNDLCFSWRCLFLRTSLETNKIQFNEGLTVGEDTIFHLEALLIANRVYAIPDPLYIHNTINNLNSLIRSPYKQYLEDSLVLQYQLRRSISEKFGLLAHDHYRKDMASYHIQTILAMLINNFRNSPVPAEKKDVARILNLKMMTDSTKELGFLHKSGNMKSYLYYLALKFKLEAWLFHFEFSSPRQSPFLFLKFFGRSN